MEEACDVEYTVFIHAISPQSVVVFLTFWLRIHQTLNLIGLSDVCKTNKTNSVDSTKMAKVLGRDFIQGIVLGVCVE